MAIYLLTKYIRNKRLRQSGIEEIDRMTGREFEEYLAVLFRTYGYHAKVTRGSGDYGADLILTKNGRKTVVQAKRYKNNVGIKSVQEIIGAVNYYQADRAMVVTNSFFTKPAINLAQANNVQLINRDQLISLILRSKREKQ